MSATGPTDVRNHEYLVMFSGHRVALRAVKSNAHLSLGNEAIPQKAADDSAIRTNSENIRTRGDYSVVKVLDKPMFV